LRQSPKGRFGDACVTFKIIGSLSFRELSYVEDLTDPGDIVLSRNAVLSPSGVFGVRFGAHLRRPVALVLTL
jgi:hypothetical protein